ncbi:hypothetical protein BD410DRAFT_785487 [Rickenella mellea]|uniref:Uncharacterized protein n=1 Tax=Rickenella mellea TaxID=50990 RepID=A0A4Y7QD48_9AGAM|nr:hypothetical protein BD410DRAFT_785487 [Rickenella mellea]
MLERDKRVGALRVVLGDSVESFAKDQIRVRSFDPCNPGPHAIFRFQYRTREFLIAQNIIQIPPTSKNKRLRSSPRPSDVDQHSKRMKPTRKVKEENLPSGSNSPPVRGDSDDVADAALEAEIRTRQQMLENLRKERQIQEEILNLQKQRRERPLKTVTVRYLEGGVIDLTGD